MKTEKIWDGDKKGFTRVFSSHKVEKVNPIEYYKDSTVQNQAITLRDILSAKYPQLTSYLDDAFFIKQAEKTSSNIFKEIENTEVPPNFLTLLETTKKKEQEKLLRGQSLEPNQLISFIFKSYSEHGFLYSKYLHQNPSKGFEDKKKPKLAHLNPDGSVKKVGEADLKDGEIKNLINHRKITVSHFFEKGDIWHCLFVTYNSIAGKENWKNGQAHFHYISSSFGITKEDFLKSLESGEYLSTPIHIKLHDYGNQAK